MSINPYWFSTIFGVYVFSGMVLTALAAITIVTVWLRNIGRLPAGLITKYQQSSNANQCDPQ